MDSIVIGTAGHVDHGKTALISALTGIDTDRLKEEKERGISIELGFASFPLADGRIAGIIDVPGHERFIHNMLAGAGGIDLVLLIIDATEGVMPQTREHLFILELLGLEKGLIVLTKMDLVEADWIDIVEEEIRDELKGTFLEEALLCRVSSVTGEGLDELKQVLNRLTLTVTPRDSQAPLRLPVDRCFTISGFGTVITGTLLQGKIRAGETVEVLPPGRKARVRNLQVFGQNVAEARAGQRVAVNLSGLEKSQVERGSVICHSGYFHLSSLIDASLKLLPGAPRGVNHLDPVHLYLGTARVVARVALLDKEELLPGDKGLVQLRLESSLVNERKDRFIIRSYSPMTTIGGGLVLDPVAARRYRRFRTKVVHALGDLEEGLLTGQEQSFVLQKLSQVEPADLPDLETATRLGPEKLKDILDELEKTGRVRKLGGSLVSSGTAGNWAQQVEEFLDGYHRRSPLSPGVSRAHLKSIISAELPLRDYDLFLEDLCDRKVIEVKENMVLRAGYTPVLSSRDQENTGKIENIMAGANFQPPFVKDLAATLLLEQPYLETLLDYLVKENRLVKINEEFYLLSGYYEQALRLLKEHFQESDTMTMAGFRDRLNSSRKYVQPLLEHFDQKKYTRRTGDFRVPWKL